MKRALILLVVAFGFALAQGTATESAPAPATSPGDASVSAPVEATAPVTTTAETGPATSPAEIAVTINEDGIPAQEAVAEEETQSCMGGGGIMSFLPMIAIIVIFYFLMIRPQQKQAKQLKEMRGAFQMNDRVITAGGIHGVIANIKTDVITVKIADGVKIDVDRNSLTLEGTPGESSSTSR